MLTKFVVRDGLQKFYATKNLVLTLIAVTRVLSHT